MVIVTNPLLDAALSYGARGWHVLALWWAEDGICACLDGAGCQSPGKHPIAYAGSRAICPAGLNSATVDPELLRQWWAWAPEANVGIVTGAVSSIIVLDSDPRHGGDESLHMLEESLPDGLPETVRALTGGGGEHVIFAHPGVSIRNKTGRDWGLPGLDVRGDGGYIVAAPSLHLSGRRYAWDAGAHPEVTPIAELPVEVVRRLTDGVTPAQNGSRPQLVAGGTDIEAILRGVPDGARGTELFKAASKMRRVDIPYGVAQDIITRAADAAMPAYPRVAALKALDSAYRRYEPSDVAETEVQDADDDAPRARFKLWTAEEIEAQPRQQWLVENVLVENCITMLAAKERSFKTFLVLDLAASVAAGIPWHGREVQQGTVVYVSAEGRAGMGKRIKAWRKARGIAALPRLFVLPEPVRMLDAKDVDELCAAMLSLSEYPRLIVLDTLARCMVGGDENKQKDANEFIDACARLQRQTGAVILLIHHVNREKGEARGSSVFPGNVDAHFHLSREQDTVTLTCKKQKDFDEFAPMFFVKEVVPLDDDESSLTLRATRFTVESLTDVEQRVMQALRVLGGVAESDGQWRDACEGISTTSYYRAKRSLMAAGFVVADRKRFLIKGLNET